MRHSRLKISGPLNRNLEKSTAGTGLDLTLIDPPATETSQTISGAATSYLLMFLRLALERKHVAVPNPQTQCSSP